MHCKVSVVCHIKIGMGEMHQSILRCWTIKYQEYNTMPEMERPDYVMYEMVLKEARKNKKPRPSSATSAWNLDDIMRKLKVK